MLRTLTAVAAVICALLLAVPAADAAGLSPTADCQAHGHLTQSYSTSQLRSSLVDMPADVQEYTNCYNVIQQKLEAQIPGGNIHGAASSSGSSGSFLPTPVIVVLVVLALGGATAGAVAIRRRGGSS